ncbi:MAG TPA: hypothetical protein VHD85_10160 [Terracidiphilus sp.]|nr:hypothetical protein [Terracidiphilus sp.]
MAEMIPIRYGGYWDVPRYIVLHYRGMLLYLRSAFDEELDDYPANYSVYKLPATVEASVQEGSWDFLNNPDITYIGEIPVGQVPFDETKCKELDASCLDRLFSDSFNSE